MTLNDIESALRMKGLRVHRYHHRIRAQCPAHDDRNPSLLITLRPDGSARFHCFAGCDPKRIQTMLQIQLGTTTLQDDRSSQMSSDDRPFDIGLGYRLLSQIWDDALRMDNPLTEAHLRARQLPFNPWRVVDAANLRKLLRQFSGSELLLSGLAYQYGNEIHLRRAFDRTRIVIPYWHHQSLIGCRSRNVKPSNAPRYLSLRGYPAEVFRGQLIPRTPIIIVEGEFKAMVLTEHLYARAISVVALPGITAAWKSLQAILDRWQIQKRFIVFDTEPSNPQVAKAANRLAKQIDGVVVSMPAEGTARVAPDDYVLQHGIDALLERCDGIRAEHLRTIYTGGDGHHPFRDRISKWSDLLAFPYHAPCDGDPAGQYPEACR